MILSAPLWLWLCATAIVSCQRADEELVARAYGNCLYRADIEGLVPEGTSSEDSVLIITNYVNQWLQQQVVLEKARKNVKKNFDKELQNYKNSLIAYEYEQMVVAQLLDTNVGDSELQEYYDSHKELFVLRYPIERSIYVTVAQESANLPQLRKLMGKKSLTDADLDAIQKIASTSAVDYDFDGDTWKPVHQLAESEQTVTVKHVYATQEPGEASPLEMERESIKTIILNRRKIDIIKNMQRDLLKEADSKGQIEIK